MEWVIRLGESEGVRLAINPPTKRSAPHVAGRQTAKIVEDSFD